MRVELLLDGAQVGKLEAPSWRAPVDLGADLLPHVLEAVPLDEQGRELGRATQRLNLPRPSAEAALVLQDRNADEPDRVTLPSLDLATTHLPQARLQFPSGATVNTHLAFGGPLVETAHTELTALPVQYRGRAGR